MSNSVNGAIDYFTNKKFGVLTSSLAPTLANMSQYKDSVFPKQAAEIEEFRATLRNMPVNELLTLHKQSIVEDSERARIYAIQEEKNRFYNQQEANADFVHWSKTALWSLDEAIALSFGKEPGQVTWKKIEPLKDKTAFAKAYAKRSDLALRATRIKKLTDPVMPVVFISWAKELHIELPSTLLSELEKVGNTAIDWRKEWLELKASYDSLQKKAPENTQQTENLLQAVACMAMDGYGDKPNDPKRTAPTEISNALKNNGKAIDRKTIKGWIDKGISLLPRKPS